MRISMLCISVCCLTAACGAGTDAVADSGVDAGTSSDADEQDVLAQGTQGHSSVQHTLALADSMFQFDPTLNPSNSAMQNAMDVQAQAMSQLNGCGMVTLSGTTVTVAFGAAPGCTLMNGTVVSGTLSLGITVSGGVVTVALTFTNIIVNGTDVAGTASFATSNGTTFTVTSALTTKGNTIDANFTVTGSSTGMTLNGPVSVTRTGATTTETFNTVFWPTGACYPNSGTVKLMRGIVNETMTFTSTTPSTGEVSVMLSRSTVMQMLPAYGTCPHS